MHDLAFADASRPRPVVILGLPLRDYSVGHELLLLAKRNPLVLKTAKEVQALKDTERHRALIEAADICCQSWEDYHRVYTKRLEKIKLAIVWNRWGKLLRSADFTKPEKEFLAYRRDGSETLPLANNPPQRGVEYRIFGQPELASLMNFLTIDCHLTRVEALNSPLGESRMRRLAHLEALGQVRIMNEHDARHEEGKAAWEAAHPENTLILNPSN